MSAQTIIAFAISFLIGVLYIYPEFIRPLLH